MKTLAAVLLILAVACSPCWAQDFLEKKVVKLGEAVADFNLTDTSGGEVRLSDYRGKIVMIHFWSATCPYVVRYEERLKKITEDYTARGVAVLGIDSNATETLDQIKGVARERGVNYPILIDPANRVADDFGAITTPHVYLMDAGGKLAFEGPVDDQGWGEANPVTKNYVRDGLDALLSGSSVPNSKVETFGCTVKRVPSNP